MIEAISYRVKKRIVNRNKKLEVKGINNMPTAENKFPTINIFFSSNFLVKNQIKPLEIAPIKPIYPSTNPLV